MTDYKGKILKYIDSRNRVHLIFNHYDESLTQSEIHTEIENQFGLKYKLDKTNTAKTFFSTTDTTQGGRYNNDGDELYRFTQTGGINLTTKVNNQTVITPQQLLNIFQNEGQESKHVNMENTLADGTTANSQKLTGDAGKYAVGSNDTLTAEKVHMVLFSNIEPPITGGIAADQPVVDGHAGGRFFITNYAYDETITSFTHSNVNWGKHDYSVQNNTAGINLAVLPEGDNRNIPPQGESTDSIMHRPTNDLIYATELSTDTPGITIADVNGGADRPLTDTEKASLIGRKPKCYFYMYTKEGDDMLVNNFNKEENRLHLLVKPYLINPVSVVATTTEGLEDKVDSNNVANIAARKIISDNLDSLKKQFDNLILGMTVGTTIKALEDRDTALNNAIDTKEAALAASNARDAINGKADSNSDKLQKHAEVLEAMSKTQNNYYNFEWTAWEKPIKVAVSKDSNNIITNLEKDVAQLRVDNNNNRKRELSTESEVSKLREDINKLTIINKSLIEIISEKL